MLEAGLMLAMPPINDEVDDGEKLSSYRLALQYFTQKEKDYLEEIKLLNRLYVAVEELDLADPKFFSSHFKTLSKEPRDIRRFMAFRKLKQAFGNLVVFKTQQIMTQKWAKVRAEQAREESADEEEV